MIEEEQKLVVEESPLAAETEKKAVGSGATVLRKAACKMLHDHGLEIAEALRKSSTQGHIQSAKFLYELAKLQEELGKTESARQIRSLASELAAEPEWDAESSEESAEIAGGRREPED